MLENKLAIVTGAARGIGLEIARQFCKQGAQVFINTRSIEAVNEAIETLRSEGLAASSFVCDVSDPVQVKECFKQYFKEHKRLDILVNNAGVLDDALIGMVTSEQVENTFATNTYSALYMSQYAARLMARNQSGCIINVSSIIGTNGNRGQAVYGGSKAALIGITKSLAKELAAQNIRVNAIAPGFIDTAMARSIPEDVFQERVGSVAMGRIGKPEEVASVALFLATDMAGYVTGQVIGVDGGMLI